MKLFKLIVVAGVVVWALPLIGVAQGERFLGTWTLNLARSSYQPGPLPTSHTRTYERLPGRRIRLTIRIRTADGRTLLEHATFRVDGRPYAIDGNPDIDAFRVVRVGPWKTRATQLRGGKVVGHVTSIVSRDGRTRTMDMTFTTATGQVQHNVLVFDRQ